MAEDLERAQNRLANIRGVDPLLRALRTISLGSWQAALKRKAAVTHYWEHLMSLLPPLLPSLQPGKRVLGRKPLTISKIVVLVIGSERGLCGRFNKVIAEHAEQYLEKHETEGIQVDLCALGSRVIRIFKRQQRTLAWSDVLSTTSIPSYRLALNLANHWLSSFESGDLDAVDVLYNAYLSVGRYAPTAVRMMPPKIPPLEQPSLGESWPPVIIETDPSSLIKRIIEQASATGIYECLLDSTIAEHSARYQLMEEAATSTQRLIDELTMDVQISRRHQITQEMQELAAGAGMIGSK